MFELGRGPKYEPMIRLEIQEVRNLYESNSSNVFSIMVAEGCTGHKLHVAMPFNGHDVLLGVSNGLLQ